MREFFHGWRRKAGCVALVMALAVVVGWVRSSLFFDFVGIHSGKYTSHTMIFEGHLVGMQYAHSSNDAGDLPPHKSLMYLGTGALTRPGHSDLLADSEIAWERHFWIFDVGENANPDLKLNGYRLNIWLVPYWCVSVPLTLLSAYLILWKPRKRKGKKTL